jgi:hypothetical protein
LLWKHHCVSASNVSKLSAYVGSIESQVPSVKDAERLCFSPPTTSVGR